MSASLYFVGVSYNNHKSGVSNGGPLAAADRQGGSPPWRGNDATGGRAALLPVPLAPPRTLKGHVTLKLSRHYLIRSGDIAMSRRGPCRAGLQSGTDTVGLGDNDSVNARLSVIGYSFSFSYGSGYGYGGCYV